MHHEDVKGAAEPSFLRPLFSDPRIVAMLVLGFASGIPYQLVYITQSAWALRSEGSDRDDRHDERAHARL
jgi:MFS transporter, PAT family, beta-lactamase induction signal transducer AmpG